MQNPFYLQQLPAEAPFCDRDRELRELTSYGEARASVVLFAPRRFGKTSLVRRVQNDLAGRGAVTLFCDFFGVASVDDVAARLARAVFARVHGRERLWKRALDAVRTFRPVLRPDPTGGVALSVEPLGAGRAGLPLLEETLDSLAAFVAGTEELVHVALDEFQEIVTLREALAVEAALRARLAATPAGWVFVGSRRRLLLGIFNERQRPFFQSAINYPLAPLPREALAAFVAERCAAAGRPCAEGAAARLAELTGGHPYYAQKLGFFAWELAGERSAGPEGGATGGPAGGAADAAGGGPAGGVAGGAAGGPADGASGERGEAVGGAAGFASAITPAHVDAALERLLQAERPVFEATVQALAPQQRLLLRAVAAEPAERLLAAAYLARHGLGSIGGVQHAARALEQLDLIEREEPADGKPAPAGPWRLTDPMLARWLQARGQEQLPAA